MGCGSTTMTSLPEVPVTSRTFDARIVGVFLDYRGARATGVVQRADVAFGQSLLQRFDPRKTPMYCQCRRWQSPSRSARGHATLSEVLKEALPLASVVVLTKAQELLPLSREVERIGVVGEELDAKRRIGALLSVPVMVVWPATGSLRSAPGSSESCWDRWVRRGPWSRWAKSQSICRNVINRPIFKSGQNTAHY